MSMRGIRVVVGGKEEKKKDGDGKDGKEEDVGGGGEVKVRVGNVYLVTYAATISVPTTENDPANRNSNNNKNESISLPQSLLEMNEKEAYQ